MIVLSSLRGTGTTAAMPHACGHSCLRAASVLRSSGSIPFVPCIHSRSLTQLHSLREWTPLPTRKLSMRCQSAVAERATAVDTPEFLQVLQARQPKRFSPDLLDHQGRLMLKNLTKSELLEWVELQGKTHSNIQTCIQFCVLHLGSI